MSYLSDNLSKEFNVLNLKSIYYKNAILLMFKEDANVYTPQHKYNTQLKNISYSIV